jgi:metal-sulfur cluster biosynthetic enzyme
MGDDGKLLVPLDLDQQEILERLDTVLDPELDESVLKLGFVEAIDAEDGRLTIKLRLPTYWCAANFSYLMASDVRRELLGVEGVQEVTVRLGDHFAAEVIEAAVNSGKSFVEAFPNEASDNLEQLRDLFLRKGYFKRQYNLLRSLRNAGLSLEAIAAVRIVDIRLDEETCRVQRPGSETTYVGPAAVAVKYLERRAELDLDCTPTTALITDLSGNPVPANKLEEHLVHARTVRLALEANQSFCTALLQMRKVEDTKVP